MERLTSRFEVGLTVDIQTPNLEHRINIIKKKLTENGYESFDNDVYEYHILRDRTRLVMKDIDENINVN